jgi:hypothetical protein
VVEEIAAFDEIRDSRLNGELHFTDNLVIESQVHEDIVGAGPKSVLYSYNL